MNCTLPVTEEEICPPRLWAHRLTVCAIPFKTPIPAPNMDRVHPHSDGSRLVPTAAIQADPISIAIYHQEMVVKQVIRIQVNIHAQKKTGLFVLKYVSWKKIVYYYYIGPPILVHSLHLYFDLWLSDIIRTYRMQILDPGTRRRFLHHANPNTKLFKRS